MTIVVDNSNYTLGITVTLFDVEGLVQETGKFFTIEEAAKVARDLCHSYGDDNVYVRGLIKKEDIDKLINAPSEEFSKNTCRIKINMI